MTPDPGITLETIRKAKLVHLSAGVGAYVAMAFFVFSTLNLFGEWADGKHVLLVVSAVVLSLACLGWYFAWKSQVSVEEQYEEQKFSFAKRKYEELSNRLW